MSDTEATSVEQALTDILLSAVDTAAQAKNFILAELPDVVQQLLLWKQVESLIWFCLGILVLLFIVWWWRWMPKQTWAHYGHDLSGSLNDDIIGPSFFLSLLLFFVGTGVALSSLEWIQIWLAPKVYLIEYAASILNSGG